MSKRVSAPPINNEADYRGLKSPEVEKLKQYRTKRYEA
jgi:hypothetical protein